MPDVCTRFDVSYEEAFSAWRHSGITLEPLNPALQPIVRAGADEADVRVLAWFVDVLGPDRADGRAQQD